MRIFGFYKSDTVRYLGIKLEELRIAASLKSYDELKNRFSFFDILAHTGRITFFYH